jgi:hypothetical protein
MAYFDSPKNSAKWEKEMASLRAERERRENGGFKPEKARNEESRTAQSVKDKNSRHRPITLKELEAIDARMTGVRRVKRPTRAKARTMDMQQGAKKASAPQRGL